jgi:hypothetical protein
MPNRDDTGGFGRPGYGGDAGRPDINDREARGRGGEDRVFGDPRARREDARLTDDLRRFERARGPRRPDFGHDENYRPGYHEGGTRFGFFGVSQGGHRRGLDDQEFDADYLSWREQQLQRHDRDYAEWRAEQLRIYDDDYWKFRSERREDFHQRFQDWRAQREAAALPPPNPDDKL